MDAPLRRHRGFALAGRDPFFVNSSKERAQSQFRQEQSWTRAACPIGPWMALFKKPPRLDGLRIPVGWSTQGRSDSVPSPSHRDLAMMALSLQQRQNAFAVNKILPWQGSLWSADGAAGAGGRRVVGTAFSCLLLCCCRQRSRSPGKGETIPLFPWHGPKAEGAAVALGRGQALLTPRSGCTP